MNLLKMLKDKASYFKSSDEDIGVASVVSHIEIAEKHYSKGKSGDSYLFNDVIYRSNQAFEGSLKEAYRIINGSADNLTPYKIEEYFSSNNVLKERVIKLFKNYRTDWRNKSTHDHNVDFTEQEAFLAIVSISAFINILFDNMIEKKAYMLEREKLKTSKAKVENNLENKKLSEKLVTLLINSSGIIDNAQSHSSAFNFESVMVGKLIAFIESAFPELILEQDKFFITNNQRRTLVDLVVESKDEVVAIEFKTLFKNSVRFIEKRKTQLLSYMRDANIKDGILFMSSVEPTTSFEYEKTEYKYNNEKYVIHLIYGAQ